MPATVLRIWGPLERDDLPGLFARVCAALAGAGPGPVLCDVGGVAADVVALEALSRLQLAARRLDLRIELRGATPELLGPAHARRPRAGLLGLEARRQAEQREDPLGAQEERELADPAVAQLDDLQRPRLVAAVRARLVLAERRRAVGRGRRHDA